MDIFETIMTSADALTQPLSCQRRDFHKYAEAGWTEMRTSSIIARKLTELGYEVLVGDQVCKRDARMGVPSDAELERQYARAVSQGADPEFVEATRGGMTGVIGILRCGEGPVVALRFDIDALGVIESEEPDHLPAREGFASVNHGVMHACGHDGHACSGLGVAQVLMQIRDCLHGTVKLIFQPSEEGVRGARSIVENGHLDDVDYLFGSHTTGLDEEGSDVTPGSAGSLATFKYDVTFRGQAAHAGGHPEQGKNALLAAACAVLNLHAISRHGEGGTRINVGRFLGGSGRNVVPDEALLELEVRGDTTALNEYMRDCALRVIHAAAQMYDCTVELKLMGAAQSVVCDPEMVDFIGTLCRETLGMKVSETKYMDVSGSEDVSYMMNRVRSHGGKTTFFRVRSQKYGAAHDRKYDFDESYITKSIKVFCAAVYALLK